MAEPVLMVDAADRVVPVEADQVEGAKVAGLVPASLEQVTKFHQDAAREAQYGTAGQAVIAGLESGASALTFGLSTAAETALGVPAEDIAAREEVNPTASGVGTALGIAAPLVLSAGAAAPASAAQVGATGARGAAAAVAAKTAPALIAKAGQAVTRGVAGALPEATTTAGKIAARALSMGLGSAVEGAAYGAGQVVHEAALGDPNLTAQSALAEIGLMAALGGGLGSALGVAEVGAPIAVRKAKEGMAALLKKAGGGVEDAFAAGAGAAKPGGRQVFEFMLEHRQEILTAEKATAGTADAIASASPQTAAWMVKNLPEIGAFEKTFPGITDIMARSTPENAAKILARRSDLVTDQTAMAALKTQQREAVQSAYEATEKALRETNKVYRPAEVARLGEESANPAAIRRRFLEIHDQIGATANTVAEKAALFAPGTEAELRNLRESVWSLYKEAKTPEAAFSALTETRRALDELGAWGKEMGPAAKRSADIARGLRSEIKGALEDEALWGAGAARTAEYHSAEAAYFSARAELRSSLMRKVKGTSSPTYVAKPETVNSWINLAADGRGQAKTAAFENYLKSGRELARQMELSGNPEAATLAAQLDAIGSQTATIQRHGAATGTIKAMQGHEILSSGPAVPLERHLAERAAGAILPGAVTSAIKGTVEAVTNPARTIAVLATLERMGQAAGRAIDAGVSTLVRGAAKASYVGRAEVEAGVAREFAAGSESASSLFSRRSKEIGDLANNPGAMADRLTLQGQSLEDHAPDTAQALASSSSRAVAFLSSKLPQPPARGILGGKWEPSRAEIARFSRYYEAVERPTVILKQAAAGTLTPEAVEAVRTVYPELFARMQRQIVEKLAGHRGAVPYPSRLAISMLLGEDVDGSLRMGPKNQAAFQGAPAATDSAAPPIKPTSKGAAAITTPGRFLTAMQSSTQRR